MPLRKVWRKFFAQSEVEFQVLKSSSAVELGCMRGGRTSRSGSRTRIGLPRYYSQHDELRAYNPPNHTKTEDRLKIVSTQDLSNSLSEMNRSSVVLAFLERPSVPAELFNIPEELLDQENFEKIIHDPLLETALAECHIFRQSPHFREGILLKAVGVRGLYPYLHFGVFRTVDENGRRFHSGNLAKFSRTASKEQSCRREQGIYQEIFSIVKNSEFSTFETSTSRLPKSRHTGYIVIGYKIVHPDMQTSLEKSWLTWTGAKQIYKCSPAAWNLKRMTLHRNNGTVNQDRIGFNGFAYVLVCEFANIIQDENVVQGLQMVEKLMTRHCGHAELYKIQWTYQQGEEVLADQSDDELPSRLLPEEGDGNRNGNQRKWRGRMHSSVTTNVALNTMKEDEETEGDELGLEMDERIGENTTAMVADI